MACVARDERKAAVGNSVRAKGLNHAIYASLGVPPAPCWSLLSCGLLPQTPWEATPSPRCRRSGSPLQPAGQVRKQRLRLPGLRLAFGPFFHCTAVASLFG